MSATEQLNHFLNLYGRRIKAPLSLKEGVCALFDRHQQEVAIIELPQGSDSVLFHCRIETLQGDAAPERLKTLLALNFEMNAMRGCWLALDAEESLRLCSQLPVATLDERLFAQSLEGFMLQAQQVREFIMELHQPA
ncbi:type III secretion system chaperone [Erwinia pyri]|uniref:Type III secretion system chaperone n=1 Tax=Erwinia pyri TaxID=3062598 RepID=A0AA50HLV7_9GAMM|nr:type III secretion system chaperone [Erwinia sp. DE2]WLS77887.1 type III secretion system chaperone [Erwinia sp. DE2]